MFSRGRFITVSAGLIALILSGPAASTAAAGGAVCSVTAEVDIEDGGGIVQTGGGQASCVGTVGSGTVDPAPVPALMSGVARRGATSCAPVLALGRVDISLLRLISFDPRRDVPFTAYWSAAPVPLVSALTGTGGADGLSMPLTGDIRFTPRQGSCELYGYGPGTIQMDLVVGDGVPAIRRTTLRRARHARR